jgi:hypothetical protein
LALEERIKTLTGNIMPLYLKWKRENSDYTRVQALSPGHAGTNPAIYVHSLRME